MPEYLSPGVYVEEVDTGSKPIEGVGTAMAAFVGYAPRGPFHTPELITNWTQFCERFGDVNGSPYMPGTYLAHSVYGYFNNGGTRCYVVRVPRAEDVPADGRPDRQPAARAAAKLGPLQIRALEAGAAGNDIKVEAQTVEDQPINDRFRLVITRGDQTETIDGAGTGRARQPLNRANVAQAVKEASKLIEVEVVEGELQATSVQLIGGTAAIVPVGTTSLVPNDFVGDETQRTGMGGFTFLDNVTIVCVPDLMAGLYRRELLQPTVRRLNGREVGTCPKCKSPIGTEPVARCSVCSAVGNEVVDRDAVEARKPQIIAWQTAMLNHCENMHDRVAVLDAPPGMNPMQIRNYRMNEGNFNSKYGTLYYPWIQVMDPSTRAPIYVPPCGHMAGIWARSDSERGVHKAPANEVVRGCINLEYSLSKGEQDTLNPDGINCIREFPGRGRLVWGARTLSADPSWRYLNIRRLFNYLEKSIERGTQWVVFEPNDYDLWQRVRRNISAFLRLQWQEGMLFGATAEEAFYVKCDEETNPPESIELGRLVCEIMVRPVYPAEFVIFRVGQWAYGSSVNET
jgi:Bacteriophage tail sheath protein